MKSFVWISLFLNFPANVFCWESAATQVNSNILSPLELEAFVSPSRCIQLEDFDQVFVCYPVFDSFVKDSTLPARNVTPTQSSFGYFLSRNSPEWFSKLIFPRGDGSIRRDYDEVMRVYREVLQVQHESISTAVESNPGYPVYIVVLPRPATFGWAKTIRHISQAETPVSFRGSVVAPIANCVITPSLEDEYAVAERYSSSPGNFAGEIDECIASQVASSRKLWPNVYRPAPPVAEVVSGGNVWESEEFLETTRAKCREDMESQETEREKMIAELNELYDLRDREGAPESEEVPEGWLTPTDDKIERLENTIDLSLTATLERCVGYFVRNEQRYREDIEKFRKIGGEFDETICKASLGNQSIQWNLDKVSQAHCQATQHGRIETDHGTVFIDLPNESPENVHLMCTVFFGCMGRLQSD